MAGEPPAKRVFGLQAKSPSLFLSLYLNLFLSPPPLGGLRPPPARSRPPGIPPSRPRPTAREQEETGNREADQEASERKRRSPERSRSYLQRRNSQPRGRKAEITATTGRRPLTHTERHPPTHPKLKHRPQAEDPKVEERLSRPAPGSGPRGGPERSAPQPAADCGAADSGRAARVVAERVAMAGHSLR